MNALVRTWRAFGLVALGAALAAPGAAAPSSVGGGQIVFLSDRPPGLGSFGVYVMNGDGSAQRALTRPEPQATDPVWLPGGRRIAFESVASSGDREIYGGVWLMRGDGSGLQWIIRGTTRLPRNPAWSRDGRRMAFVRNNTLYVARADGRRRRGLFRAGRVLYRPVWSADGRRLALSSGDPALGGRLLVLTVGVRHAKVVLRTREPAGAPSWSPEGRKLAFTGRSGGLNVIDADGRHRRRLTHGRVDLSPTGSWSPDGTRIVIGRATRHGYAGVSVVDVKTGRMRTISRTGVWPQWSPAGRSIAFAASRPTPAVYLVRPDGSHLRRLVPFWGMSRFSPSGAKLAIVASPSYREGVVFVVNANGTHLRQLTHPFSDGEAVGSPDHQKIAFVRRFAEDPGADGFGHQPVYVIGADGSALHRIGLGDSPAWAPDSAHVAFTRDGDIYTAPVAGGAVAQLTSGSETDMEPTWSRDGGAIAFTRVLSTSAKDVCLVHPTRPGATTCLSAGGGSPAWSPDGTMIAFTVGDRADTGVSVGVIRPDGSGRQLVAHGYEPSWAPDSRRLAFVDVSETQDGALSIVSADGSGVLKLGMAPSLPEAPSWSPDGSRIASASCPPQIYDCEIWSTAADDSSSRRLTANRADDVAPVWWP